jgi:hypothetical protein
MRMTSILAFSFCASLAVGHTAFAQSPQYPPAGSTTQLAPAAPASDTPPTSIKPPEPGKKLAIEFTTLNLMRQKGIITQAEYDSAMRDLGDTVGAKAGESLSLMLSKWSLTFYGFVELDVIHDSTQSLNEVAGNTQIPKQSTYAGTHDRFMMGVRNSRFGFRIRSPEFHHVRVSGNLEFDGLGNQAAGLTEGQIWTNPAIRIRHYYLKVETPIVDILAGQYWSLYGWQTFFLPNTIEIMGVPNLLFHRDAQLRVSKTIKSPAVNFEIAAAMVRPPQRESGVPEGQGGLRLIVNKWKGMQTVNSTGTALAPLSIGVSGTVRQFRLTEFSAAPKSSTTRLGWGVAAGGFIPLIPATETRKSNALSVTGEFSYSRGVSDQYTGLTGGVANAAIPAAMPGGMTGTWTPNIDNGMIVYSADGTAHLINWQTFVVGIQYYLPINNGKVWVAAAYSHGSSDNTQTHLTPAATRNHSDWADANVSWDVVGGLRLGVEYAWTQDTYNDKIFATNHRIQGAAFYLF